MTIQVGNLKILVSPSLRRRIDRQRRAARFAKLALSFVVTVSPRRRRRAGQSVHSAPRGPDPDPAHIVSVSPTLTDSRAFFLDALQFRKNMNVFKGPQWATHALAAT